MLWTQKTKLMLCKGPRVDSGHTQFKTNAIEELENPDEMGEKNDN